MVDGGKLEQRLLAGIELFNCRQFFECHEVLEDLWNEQGEPERQLTQGLIQIAVAYHHCLRGNRTGALKLFGRGIARLKPFVTDATGLCLDKFVDEVEADYRSLTAAGSVPELLIPRLQVV